MRQVVEVGNIIALDQPLPSHPAKRRIFKVLHEHEYQKYEGAEEPSYASILLSSEEAGDSKKQSLCVS